MKIVLTGFMGTGKTSVGRELSRMLGYRFIDTDSLIEEEEGMPISLIFKQKGEDYFRGIEQETVKRISQLKNAVIATGGGVIKNRNNVERLGTNGILVWLKANPEIIMKRVMLEGGKRPLLNVKEPLDEISRLLSERLKFYESSDTSLDTDYITPQETAHEIVETLGLDRDVISVDLGERSYEIIIGSKLLDKLGLRLKQFRPSRVAIVSNETLFPIFRDVMMKALGEYNIVPEILLIPDGEEYKDHQWTYFLYGELLKAKFDRKSVLVALGGGVVGDITGFVASTYMRGIKYVQAPTTLLAQVDSSVGGKTGVNHPLGKNMIGTFHQPSLVLIDVDTLRTLPKREFYAGMAEIIKYGVIADRKLFDFLAGHRDDILSLGNSLISIIRRSCEIKAEIVSKDEREGGLRAILNYGHTLGHALETVTGYKKLLHGEAVAIGMAFAADVSVRIGMLREGDAANIRNLLKLYQLPHAIPDDIDREELAAAIEVDKKADAGKLNVVLPQSIGAVKIEKDVDRNLIKELLQQG